MQWKAMLVMAIALVASVALGNQCSAIEEDMDYYGYDITSTRQVRAEDCCQDCIATTRCAMFVWSNGTCWLKSLGGSRYSSFGKRAGFVHRSTQCGAIQEDTDYSYYSTDLKLTRQPRAEACCSDCAATNGCAAWVWYNDTVWYMNGVPSTGTCYLKSYNAVRYSNYSVMRRPGRRAAVYKNYVPTPPPPPSTSSYYYPPSNYSSPTSTTTYLLYVSIGMAVMMGCVLCISKCSSTDATPSPGTPRLEPVYIDMGRRRQDIDDKGEHLWRCSVCAFENASDKDACPLCETTRGFTFDSPEDLNALQHCAWARNAWSRTLNKYDQRPMWTQRTTHVLSDNAAFYVIGAAPQPAPEPDHEVSIVVDSPEPPAPSAPLTLTWQPLTRECAGRKVDGSALPVPWFNEPDESGNPVTVPFQEKYATTLIHLTHTVTTHIKIRVHRDTIWTDSVEALLDIRPESLASKTKIVFLGEDGIDAGGVQREWYSLMAQAFLDHELFVEQANRTLGLNPVYPDATHFLALGRFLARAIVDGQVLPLSLTAPLFKALLGTPLSIHDVRYIDETTYRSLLYVRDTDCVEALGLDFTWTLADGRSVELVDGGSDVAVTAANQAEYVACLVRYWLLDAVRVPLEQVVRGFYDVLAPEVMLRFDYKELELVVCGTSDINVVEWQFETVASPELTASAALGWFWDVVERDMRPHDRAKLLQFTTGSSRVPLQGFQALTGNDGQLCPFTLRGVPYTKGALPKVQTCFNRILLPLYPSRELMREALFVLVNMEVRDFTMQ